MPDTVNVNIAGSVEDRQEFNPTLVDDINVHVAAIIQLLVDDDIAREDITYVIDINDQTKAEGAGTDYADPDPDPEA